MMVFCARGFGLYANLTRFIFFRQPHAEELERFAFCKTVEARLLSASAPGASLSELYQTAAEAYKDLGHREEIQKHHQGGVTGYLSREHVATPESPRNLRLEIGMALAWNPSFPGAKIEDTILLTENGIEILTVDRLWPTSNFAGRERPEIWVKT
jgi:Xaa-Pro aminopeptidase